MIPPVIIQQVVAVHDGDTLTLANGIKIRAAGIDANELNGKRHKTCATMTAIQSRDWLRSQIIGTTISCQPVGKSYQRIVARCRFADGRDLACTSVKVGASVIWETYWRRLHMGVCE